MLNSSESRKRRAGREVDEWSNTKRYMAVRIVTTPFPIWERMGLRIMKLNAPTAERSFSGMNRPNPQGMDSTPLAFCQRHAPIRAGKDQER